MKACPRCIRAYSSLDIYCGSCGTIRCADEVPKLMRRFTIHGNKNNGHPYHVLDKHAGAGRSYICGAFLELEHAEIFRNCLVALELGKIEEGSATNTKGISE